MKVKYLGIDYGSNLAGTTCVVWLNKDNLLTVRQVDKKRNADNFLKDIIDELNPGSIFIDAPLSLPGAYFGNGTDYFFREADRISSAMSPMFIGGLTARAMKLKNELDHVHFFEAYPGGLARSWELNDVNYKKGAVPNPELISRVKGNIDHSISKEIFSNWHRVDALLAWQIGFRFENDTASQFGNKREGIIYV